MKQSGEIHIVLDCDYSNVITVLREAREVGMMTAYHNYLITTLDLHLVDMDEFKGIFRYINPMLASDIAEKLFLQKISNN